MMYKIFILLVCFSNVLSCDGRHSNHLPIPSEFGFIASQTIPYGVSSLLEVNPETQQTYADDIRLEFHRTFKKSYAQFWNKEFKGTESEIDHVYYHEILGGISENSDFSLTHATLIFDKFKDRFTFYLPESQLKMGVQSLLKQKLSRFSGLLESDIPSIVDTLLKTKQDYVFCADKYQGVYIQEESPDSTVVLVSWGDYVGKSRTFRSKLPLPLFECYLMSYFKTVPSENFLDFLEKSRQSSGVLASEDGLFPGILISSMLINPLVRQYESNWTCGNDVGMVSTALYESDCNPVSYYGSIVFPDNIGIYEQFHKFVGDNPGAIVLDVAGAIGANSLRHLPTNPVILNDINITELATAYAFVRQYMRKDKHNLRLNSLPAQDLMLADNSVGAAFIGFLVKYLTGSQIDCLFEKAYNFMAPGGRLFVIELNQDNEWYKIHDCELGSHVPSSENWANELGYLFKGTRISGVKAEYFLHNVSQNDLVSALTRAGFKINNFSQKGYIWVVGEKPKLSLSD